MPISIAIKKYKYLYRITNLLFDLFFFVLRNILVINKTKNGNVVIVALNKLGDSVFTIPAMKEIIAYYKKNIVLLTYPETEPIYKIAFPELSIVIIKHEQLHFHDRIAGHFARKTLKFLCPGIIYDFTGSIRSASLIFNSRASEVIGINEEHYKGIFTSFCPIKKKPHIIDIYYDAIEAKIKCDRSEYSRTFPVYIEKNGKILIHPFAGWSAKEWNMEKFIDLSLSLNKEYSTSFVIPVNTIKKELLGELNRKGIEVLETSSTEDLIRLIKNSSMMVSNDSGPVYIASLLGKPTFTIFGPTNPMFHLPYGKAHRFIQKTIHCSPKEWEKLCYKNGGYIGCPVFECMNNLSLKEVYDKLKEFINELGILKKIVTA
jgi:ADP-heptose:LPS heptosyltransferase